ncbi:polymorphic toxin-type HINT domain-containing protein [Streptomyces sp. NPDC096080]|uniref:polymorphic toxin-type HINT domain-containing protein n=1 Tax=Streptomyces sp. NPDC096080 TaxID=3156693 RepID=UPI00331D24A5
MYGKSRSRRAVVRRRRVALGVSTALIATLLQAVTFVSAPGAGAADPSLPAAVDPDRPVAVDTGIKAEPRRVTKTPRTPQTAPAAAWPETASVVVRLDEPESRAGAPVQAEGLPVKLNTPAKRVRSATGGHVEARVLSRETARRAGVDGLLVTLEAQEPAAAGVVGATVDYASFAQSFGGAYASRLTLVSLPPCALDSPTVPRCRTATPVPTFNDTEAKTLTASSVKVRAGAPTVLAAVADDTGKTGDFKATPLAASSTWDTNLNSGDFTWSYSFPVPNVPGEFSPAVSLSYSSGAIDGRTGNSNNQSSWAGDGFDLWSGYIERRYKPCADDGQKADDGVNKPGDLCWGYDNAYISLNGKSGELVQVAKDEFRLKQDDGTRIDRLKSSNRGSSDADGEYWRVTDPLGNRYYFGYNRLPGWTEGKETTDSTWSVPVYGNDADEPCHASTFAASWCQQAWRWNLDYSVDTHSNAVAYYYNTEDNSYGRNLKASDNTRYTRGGYLDRIEYGLKSSSMYGTKALAKVGFTSSERCIADGATDCSSITKDAPYWYDTPWDMNCNAATDCDRSRLSPTFWTRKRLTGITTQVLNAGSYSTVDSWALSHRWGKADIDYQLLLDSVQQTGHAAATPITLPKTTLAYTQLENRLDKIGDGYAPFVKARLSSIADEHGGQTDVTYSAPACAASSPPTPETNTSRCFPQLVGGSDTQDPELHWFNKYVVTSVTSTDRTGHAPDGVTAYEYLDGAAWHYDDDNGLVKEKNKTWSQWRGYGHVRVKSGGQGGGTALKTQEDSYFLRGMDGDRKNAAGGSKSVSISLGADEGEPITDHESAAGFAYRTETYSAPGGKVLEKTVKRPWHHETGRRERSWGTVTSNFTGVAETRTLTSLDNGAGAKWRVASQAMTYDTVAGRLIRVGDYGAGVADNTCTRNTYATNTDANILGLLSRTETVSGDCSDTPDRTKDVLSDERTAYDGGAYEAAPTKGDATATARISKHDGTTATYLESGTTYDSYGRMSTSTDLTADVRATEGGVPVRTARKDGVTTSTVYSPGSGFPTTVTTTGPPANASDAASAQTSTTTLEPLRGQPTTEKDTNGKVTTFTFDALGRSDKIWLADRKTGQLPSYDFDYFISDDKPVAVRTLTLNNNGAQVPSWVLYDGQLRTRQTQDVGPAGGVLVTDTFYDERGQVAKTFAPYYTAVAPSRELLAPQDALGVETQTRHSYDGLGRETETRDIAGNGDGGTVLGITQSVYGGDRTTVIPPEGGTATTTLTDVRGRVTELRQHHTRSASAAYDTTTYTHSLDGNLKKVTDQAGNVWSYEYDLLGRQIRSVDPDKGVTDTRYDDRGLVTTTSDANGAVLHHSYDQLGRPTQLRDDNATGKLRAAWTYDTVDKAQGQLASATRYVDGAEYTSKVTQYDQLYRALRTSVTIPDTAENKGLAGTYQTGTSYKPSGVVAGVSYSAAGSLPGGSYSYSYDDTLRPVSLLGDGFKADTSYSLTGKPLSYTYASTASGAKKTQVTNTFEWGTQRLATSRVDRQDVAGVDRSNTYRYDQAGNVLSVSDVSRTGTDNQCFAYDYLRRLTEAWTEGDPTCQSTASATDVGGPAPYWTSYTYDKTGNRQTETLHDLTGQTSKDTRLGYAYPASSTQPHTLKESIRTGPTGTVKTSYTYDATGNTKTRTISGDTQKLDWDAEGHLTGVTQPVAGKADEVTRYLYGADGERLMTRGPEETTLYLGHTELVLTKGATKAKATRYIDLGSGNQAVQTDDGKVAVTIADQLGTGQLAIGVADLTMSQRRTLPFGGNRGATGGAWPGTKGFVGGTDETDSTGLTHLGAREYDSTTGRFLSVDPVMDLTDPQQINGYTYSNNSPLSFSDPTGLRPISLLCGTSGRCSDGTKETFSQNKKTGGYDHNYSKVSHSSRNDGSTVFTTTEYTNGVKKSTSRVTVGKNGVVRGVPDEGENHLITHGKELFQFFVFDYKLAEQCVGGLTSECGWLAADVPFFKIFKLFKFGKIEKLEKLAKACQCFLAGTGVLMADGQTKNIEDIKVGEKVLATDPRTGEKSEREVTATIITESDKKFTDLTIATPDGGKHLTATYEHPFWVISKQDWVAAGDLEPGMTLRTDDGASVKITATRQYTASARTYNLTVEGVHTYYVLAGETPVLVHNSNGNCGVTDLAAKIDVENLSMTKTVENHTWDIAGTRDVDAPNFGKAARPYMNGNNGQLLRGIMEGSAPRMDSRGAPGVVEWRTPGAMNGSNGIWELNIDANSNRIVHFLFKSTKG